MPGLIALAQGGPQDLLRSPLIPLGMIIGILWFLVFRPQRQQEQRHRELLAALKVGDKVVTSGGICGVIDRVEERKVKLKVADNVRIEVLRSAVAGLQQDGPAAGEKPGA